MNMVGKGCGPVGRAEGGVSKLATEFYWALNSTLETPISSGTPTSVPGP